MSPDFLRRRRERPRYGKIRRNEWPEPDTQLARRTLRAVEDDLGLKARYDVHLTQNEVDIPFDDGSTETVKEAGLVIDRKRGIKRVIITQEDLDIPTEVRVLDKGRDQFLVGNFDREDIIIGRVAEELHHLKSHLEGIDVDAAESEDPRKYERPGEEQNALFYRISTLGRIRPKKWSEISRALSEQLADGNPPVERY